MIGKNTIKLIKSLALKKYRTKEELFLVEGDKLVSEVINSANYQPVDCYSSVQREF